MLLSYIFGAVIVVLGIAFLTGVGISDTYKEKYTELSLKDWAKYSGLSDIAVGIGFLLLGWASSAGAAYVWVLYVSVAVMVVGLVVILLAKYKILTEKPKKGRNKKKKKGGR